ncbi:MAG: hypothetical protein ABIA59_00325 [Candidatus Latescibacterota bacterium]
MRKILLIFCILLLHGEYVLADPCLVIYPRDRTVFYYDSSRYALITQGDPGYNHSYSISGNVLWDTALDRIASEVYQAPNLNGFTESHDGRSVFYTPQISTTIVIDGFHDAPRQLSDIYLRFLPFPRDAFEQVYINGELLTEPAYHIPSLSVTTPAGCCFYSDAITLDITWSGAKSLLVMAFADKNGNHVFDGEPCFHILLEDPTVPVAQTTWGHIKSLYKD